MYLPQHNHLLLYSPSSPSISSPTHPFPALAFHPLPSSMNPQQQCVHEEGGSHSKGGSGGYICSRQSTSTRWTPTSDQIRILKELYYNHGVRSPDSDQIQRISSRLRQYGKIEGKNVFYWFQNHKARERQKKRSISDNNHLTTRPPPLPRKADDPLVHLHRHHPNLNGFCGSPLLSFACGSMAVENRFKDCSTSAAGAGENGGANGSFSWAAIDPYSYAVFSSSNSRRIAVAEGHAEREEEEEEEEGDTVETLPLFPVHSEEDQLSGVSSSSSSCCMPKSPENSCPCHHQQHHHLELTLNSFSTT